MTNSAASPSPDRARKNEMLGDEITLLAGQLDAGSYRMIKLIAEFDEHKAWGDGGGVKSCAHWLNWKCGIDMGAAREKVRVAHCLENQSEAQLVFTTPSGRRIEADLSPQFPPQVAQTAKEALQRAAPDVDAKTCITRWQGESCDYGMAIEGLLRRDGNLHCRRELDPHLTDSV